MVNAARTRKERRRSTKTNFSSNSPLLKNGSKVEVCTNEEGFKDAWYVATLLKSTSLTALVEYETLVSEDDQSKPLMEYVDPSTIRPLPPPLLDKEECFEAYDVVDAFYRDGWWKGVVTKVEEERCNVVFENPPHEIWFRASLLRFHFDWINGSWEKPPKQMRMQGLIFNQGMPVEVYLDSNGVWFPATVIDKVGFNSFLVMLECANTGNDCSPANIIIDSFHIRPCPPLNLALKDFELYENVDAFCGSAWRYGLIIKKISDGRYIVLLKNTMEERLFTRSEMRPHMNWTDGKWDALVIPEPLEMLRDADKNMQNALVESARKSHVDESSCRSTREESIEQTSLAKPMSRKGKQIAHDSEARPLCPKRIRKEVNPRKEVDASCEEMEGFTNAKMLLRGVEEHIIPKGGSRDLESQDLVDLPISVWVGHAGSLAETYAIVPRVDYTAEKVHLDETSSGGLIGSQPLPLCYEGHTPVNSGMNHVIEGGDDAGMQTSILGGSRAPEENDIPFVKSSHIWKEVESMEVFRSMPQKPHFLPLVKYNEESREGMAIGYMIVFANVVEKASKVQVDDPIDPLNRCLQTLTELELLGFDVNTVADRLKKLLCIKERRGLLQDVSKEVDTQIAEHSEKKSKIEKDIDLIDKELQALEEKWTCYLAMKFEKESQIASLQIDVDGIKERVLKAEDEFRNVVAAPW